MYYKYAIMGQVIATTFLKNGASPPALDNYTAATVVNEKEAGNAVFIF